MKKLYTVSVSFDYVVVADDEKDACVVAEDCLRDALRDIDSHDVMMDISEGDIAYNWDDMCIPYGGDGNTRTGEYKANLK